jgi:hypothetical protein
LRALTHGETRRSFRLDAVVVWDDGHETAAVDAAPLAPEQSAAIRPS